MAKKVVSILMLVVILLGSRPLVFAAKFSLGDAVEVFNTGASGLVVRDAPAGNSIGKKYDGSRGMILAGPQSASYGGVVYTWWKVRWGDDALEGWSVEDYLRKVTISPSTKFSVGNLVKVGTGGPTLIVRTDPPPSSDLSYKGSVADGTVGKVVGGPFYGVAQGASGFYHFWKVDFLSIQGWSAENWLTNIGGPTITSSLVLVQSPPYYVGNTITARFTITNRATAPFTFDVLTVGGRDPDSQVADFSWIRSITLSVGASYNYQGTLTLTKVGNYHFFCTYRTLWGDWNPNISTEGGATNTLDIYVNAAPPPPNQPPYTPSYISPSNHASSVSISTTLSWTGGDPDPGDTVTYDVYFGVSSSPPLVSSGQSGTTYNPGTLSQSMTYYWKIVSRDNHGLTTPGPVWDFTTLSSNQLFSLSNGYVSPTSGDISTTFNYYVTYSDPEGDVPTTKNVYIDGSACIMTKISGDYVSGAVFKYSTTLPAGSHNYYYYFADSAHSQTRSLPSSGTYSGPNVSALPTSDFSISASPYPLPLSIPAGTSDKWILTVTSISGFAEAVHLEVTGIYGVELTCPSSVNPPIDGSIDIDLKASVYLWTQPGIYSLTVTGSYGDISHALEIYLAVGLPPPPEISSWKITNLYETSHFARFWGWLGDQTGFVTECDFEVFVTDYTRVKIITIEGSYGTVYPDDLGSGHYKAHMQFYDRSLKRIFLNSLNFAHDLTYESDPQIPDPLWYEKPDYPHAWVNEITILDTNLNLYHITQSKSGQTLPVALPTFEDAFSSMLSSWKTEGGMLFRDTSSADFLITDSLGRRVGALYENGQFIASVNEIPDAFYSGRDSELQITFIPSPFLNCSILMNGREEGNYTMTILSFEGQNSQRFIAIDIPSSAGEIHEYTPDWQTLSEGGHGMSLNVDSNGDGVFEYAFASDHELTRTEFLAATLPSSLLVNISPLSASLLVGQSVTFTSTVTGGTAPYSHQWYLNGAPVSGEISSSWAFAPSTSGIYYVYLKVTDAVTNTVQSDTARIVVSTTPVGGYSITIQPQTTAQPIGIYLAFTAFLTAIFTKVKPKTKRKR